MYSHIPRSDDPKLKFDQLQVWRQRFKAEHKGKEPMVWIDKVGTCSTYT